jgi:hypothetical protein
MPCEPARDEIHHCQRQPTRAERAFVAEFERKWLRDLRGVPGVNRLQFFSIRSRLRDRLFATLLGCEVLHVQREAVEELDHPWRPYEQMVAACVAAFGAYVVALKQRGQL